LYNIATRHKDIALANYNNYYLFYSLYLQSFNIAKVLTKDVRVNNYTISRIFKIIKSFAILFQNWLANFDIIEIIRATQILLNNSTRIKISINNKNINKHVIIKKSKESFYIK